MIGRGGSYVLLRLSAAVGSGLLAVLSASSFWSKVINSPLPGDKIWFLIGGLPMGVGAVLLAWIALRGHEPQTRAAARSGCGTGAWFVLIIILSSFFVPLVLPDWGQAPLLAFLIAPAAFAVGTLGGVLWRTMRKRET